MQEWRTGLDENGHWKINGLSGAPGLREHPNVT
jgi:hypothetical protein